MRSIHGLVTACACLALSQGGVALAQSGALTQLPGTDACVSEDGTGGACADGVALNTAVGVAVSPEGRNVYVTSFFNNSVAAFARDPRTGALTQLPGSDACVSEDGSDGVCAAGVALEAPSSVAVSPDGRNVYVAADFSDAVTVFARDRRTGALTQLAGTDACISEDGTGGACAVGVGLDAPIGVTVSPDGRNVYVGSVISDAVTVFARDRRTGALTQLAGTDACVSEGGTGGACADGVALRGAQVATVSRDGRNVYVASFVSHAVAVFARDRRTGALTQLAGTDACISEDGTGGACADGEALVVPRSAAISHDGRNVYVGSEESAALAVFARDRRTGALTQLAGTDGCISEDGTGGACADGVALAGAEEAVVSRDGRNVYLTASLSDAVVAFARDRRTGALTQLPGAAACVSEDGTGGACLSGVALEGTRTVALSRDGRNAYVASFVSDAVAVLARDRTGRALAAR